MKHLLLLMAVVGLAATGCAQNRVLGPHARRGGADMNFVKAPSTPRTSIQSASNYQSDGDVQQAMFGLGGGCDDACCGCDDVCCGDCAADCCCDSGCCGDGCCEIGCCDDGCCGDSCSNCGGQGCGLCQRFVGRVANGFCPHAAGYPESYNYTPSPAAGQVAYPYYTVRGPRDFLRNNPPSIGPY